MIREDDSGRKGILEFRHAGTARTERPKLGMYALLDQGRYALHRRATGWARGIFLLSSRH